MLTCFILHLLFCCAAPPSTLVKEGYDPHIREAIAMAQGKVAQYNAILALDESDAISIEQKNSYLQQLYSRSGKSILDSNYVWKFVMSIIKIYRNRFSIILDVVREPPAILCMVAFCLSQMELIENDVLKERGDPTLGNLVDMYETNYIAQILQTLKKSAEYPHKWLKTLAIHPLPDLDFPHKLWTQRYNQPVETLEKVRKAQEAEVKDRVKKGLFVNYLVFFGLSIRPAALDLSCCDFPEINPDDSSRMITRSPPVRLPNPLEIREDSVTTELFLPFCRVCYDTWNAHEIRLQHLRVLLQNSTKKPPGKKRQSRMVTTSASTTVAPTDDESRAMTDEIPETQKSTTTIPSPEAALPSAAASPPPDVCVASATQEQKDQRHITEEVPCLPDGVSAASTPAKIFHDLLEQLATRCTQNEDNIIGVLIDRFGENVVYSTKHGRCLRIPPLPGYNLPPCVFTDRPHARQEKEYGNVINPGFKKQLKFALETAGYYARFSMPAAAAAL